MEKIARRCSQFLYQCRHNACWEKQALLRFDSGRNNDAEHESVNTKTDKTSDEYNTPVPNLRPKPTKGDSADK